MMFFLKTHAQQPLTYNLHSINLFSINPAAAGYDERRYCFVNSYNQWKDFGMAPKVLTCGVSGPVYGNMSLGATFIRDTRTAFNHLSGSFMYAYKFMINPFNQISFGTSVSIINNYFDVSKVTAFDMTDPRLVSSSYNHIVFSTGAGIVFNHNRFQVHASLPQLLEQGKRLSNQMNVGMSYNFHVKEIWRVKPSVLLRTFPSSIPQYEGNILGSWNKIIMLQAGYRSDNSLVFVANIVSSGFSLAYAYQYNLGYLKNLAKNTSEVQLGIILGELPSKKKKEIKSVFCD